MVSFIGQLYLCLVRDYKIYCSDKELVKLIPLDTDMIRVKADVDWINTGVDWINTSPHTDQVSLVSEGQLVPCQSKHWTGEGRTGTKSIMKHNSSC